MTRLLVFFRLILSLCISRVFVVAAIMLTTLLVAAPSFAFTAGTIFPSAEKANFSEGKFLPADKAFAFDTVQTDEQLYLNWHIAPGYYLYQDRISVEPTGVTLAKTDFPPAKPYNDEFFGDVHIYAAPATVLVQLNKYQSGAQLKVTYQGCSSQGFCYPPETRLVTIEPFADAPATIAPPSHNVAIEPETNSSIIADDLSTNSSATDSLGFSFRDLNANALNKLSGESRNAGVFALTLVIFLLLGIALAFTPCVLPMYPILASIVLGGGQLNLARAFSLSFVYVQGMALTYTLLGLVVASVGLKFQAFIQSPSVLIIISILFVLLALSMFGLYNISLPSSVQTKLNALSNQQQGGKLWSVFLMGAISGLVCSPCTSAPLSGALVYVAQTGDLLFGGATLYALALGMGLPLIAMVVFGNKLIPKAGGWMIFVKTFFGFLLLSAPIFLLERLLPDGWSTGLWLVLAVTFFAWLYYVHFEVHRTISKAIIGVIAILGLVGSGIFAYSAFDSLSPEIKSAEHLNFTQVASLNELEKALSSAKQQGKPVMLDFYADWCTACKEYEKYTFSDAGVKNVLRSFVLLQIDATKTTPEIEAILTKYQVLGLPTIDFWNDKGDWLIEQRLTGFVPSAEFLAHIQGI